MQTANDVPAQVEMPVMVEPKASRQKAKHPVLEKALEESFAADAAKSTVTAEAPKAEKPVPKFGEKLLTKDTGVTSLVTLDEQIHFAALLMKNGMISETFKTAQEVLIGIQYAKAMTLDPIIALRMMYVLNGKPTLWGDGPLSLAWRSKLLVSVEEFFIDDSGERICAEKKNLRQPVFGAVTRLWRKGDPLPQEDHFTLADLELAGIDKNKQGTKVTWQKYRRIMMRYKARTLALKSKCTDLINGIPIAEFDFNYTPEVPEITEFDHEKNSVKGFRSFVNDQITNEINLTVPGAQ